MNWKKRRAIGTALFASAPYLAWSFIAFDPTASFHDEVSRAVLFFSTLFLGAATYTFPGWSWE